MKKILLLIALFTLGPIFAQGNGDIVQFDWVRSTPGESYNQILYADLFYVFQKHF